MLLDHRAASVRVTGVSGIDSSRARKGCNIGVSVLAGPALPINVVFDVDGCLTVAGRAIPGGGGALDAVAAIGARVLIATNNSTAAPETVADRLSAILDHTIAPEAVVTSAMAAVAVLRPSDAPVLVVGERGIHHALEAADLATTTDPDQARTVLVGMDRAFDYAAMSRAGRAIAGGARLVATNDDRTFPSAGPGVPGAGAILASIEAASGVRALVCGKPHPPMLDLLRPRLASGVTWMVGDRIETDVAFARAAGFTAILVLTGVTPPHGEHGDLTPDVELASVAALGSLLTPQ